MAGWITRAAAAAGAAAAAPVQAPQKTISPVVQPATTVSRLAQELRAQAPGTNWQIEGIDRAEELAVFLESKGVRTLAGLQVKQGRIADAYKDVAATDRNKKSRVVAGPQQDYLDFSGVKIGNEGDIYSPASRYSYITNGNEFAESNKGHGGVSFTYRVAPGGRVVLAPVWESSSDMGDVQDFVKAAAVFAGMVAGGVAIAGTGAGVGTAGAAAEGITAAAVQAETVAAVNAATAGWVTPTLAAEVAATAAAPSITAALAAALPAAAPVVLPGVVSSITPAAVQAETVAAVNAATAGWVTPTLAAEVAATAAAPSITAALAAALPAAAPVVLPEVVSSITPAAVHAETVAAVDAAVSGWVTPTLAAEVAATAAAPSITAALAAATPAVPAFTFNAAADSQAASSALGITGAQSAAAATVPAAVNLGSLGGIVSTAPAPGWVGTLNNAAEAAGNLIAKEATATAINAAKAAVIGALMPNAGPAEQQPVQQPATTQQPTWMAAALAVAAIFMAT